MPKPRSRRETHAAAKPHPQAAITFNPETGKYSYSVWMPGKRRHDMMEDVFDSPEDAKNWIDPHRERVWEASEPSNERIVAISHGYIPGSMPTRL